MRKFLNCKPDHDHHIGRKARSEVSLFRLAFSHAHSKINELHPSRTDYSTFYSILVGPLSLQTPAFVHYYIQPAFIFSGLALIHPAGILLKNFNSLGLIT